MRKKRFSVEQMIGALKQAQVGVPAAEVIREVGIARHLHRDQLGSLSLPSILGVGMIGLFALTSQARPKTRRTRIPYQFGSNSYHAMP